MIIQYGRMIAESSQINTSGEWGFDLLCPQFALMIAESSQINTSGEWGFHLLCPRFELMIVESSQINTSWEWGFLLLCPQFELMTAESSQINTSGKWGFLLLCPRFELLVFIIKAMYIENRVLQDYWKALLNCRTDLAYQITKTITKTYWFGKIIVFIGIKCWVCPSNNIYFLWIHCTSCCIGF